MSIHVEPNHPLAELLGCLLHGIEIVPAKEQSRMVRRAIGEAVKWHDQETGCRVEAAEVAILSRSLPDRTASTGRSGKETPLLAEVVAGRRREALLREDRALVQNRIEELEASIKRRDDVEAARIGRLDRGWDAWSERAGY